MNIRPSTERAYREFLDDISKITTSYSIGGKIKQHAIDVKFKGFLKKYEYIKQVSNNDTDTVINNVEISDVGTILEYFKMYRDDLAAKAKKKDSTTSEINSRDIVTMAARFAALGTKHGVVNLEGFIIDMIKEK